MRSMRPLVVALIGCGVFAAPVLADDIKAALNDFGLIGSWCRNEPGRVVFVAPVDGNPTATVRDEGGPLITTVYDVTEAKMLSTDQINVGLHPTKITRSDGKSASQHDYDDLHVVFKKAGEKIEVIKMGFDNMGEPIDKAIFFERCAD